MVYECLSSFSGRCCALPLFHHIITFLQSPVDFWRTRGGHQNSRRGQGINRPNRTNNNPVPESRRESPVDNSLLNDVGRHSTTMATIITTDGDVTTNQLIRLTDAGKWSNGSDSKTKDELCSDQNENQKEREQKGAGTSGLTSVTCMINGEHKALTVPSDTTQVTGNITTNQINGSLV